MPVKKKKAQEKLTDIAVRGMIEKKGQDIVTIDFSKIPNAICTHFVICHGSSRPQVEALADSVEAQIRETTGLKPWHREGFQNAEWVLLDYIDMVVHIFQENIRQFYRLEDLWADAEITKIESQN